MLIYVPKNSAKRVHLQMLHFHYLPYAYFYQSYLLYVYGDILQKVTCIFMYFLKTHLAHMQYTLLPSHQLSLRPFVAPATVQLFQPPL